MWPFKSRAQRKRIALRYLEDMIDYREGALDAVNTLHKPPPETMVNDLAYEWFYLVRAISIVRDNKK
jgi:hypothetical protein